MERIEAIGQKKGFLVDTIGASRDAYSSAFRRVGGFVQSASSKSELLLEENIYLPAIDY
ncbi:MAG: hypothetical protein R3B45_02420 [Bdellovibrionota bacterium]